MALLATPYLVEGQGEATIDVESMEHSHANHTTNKIEIGQVFL